MKESYFTAESLESKTESMLGDVIELRDRHPFDIQPLKPALLVLDMQKFFLDETSHAFIPSVKAIIPGIRELSGRFLDNSLPVFFSKHVNIPSESNMMYDWWKDLPAEGNPVLEISEQFRDLLDGCTLFEKSQYDAFIGTSLETELKNRCIKQIVITGVMTHLCCETTARSAFMKGFEVFFPIDGTATYMERFHRASILNLAHGFAHPVIVSELIKGFGSGNAG